MTQKKSSSDNIGYLIGNFALNMLIVRDQMQIYHWQTKSHARHKASDSFVENLTKNIDTFLEVIQGHRNTRIKFSSDSSSSSLKLSNITDEKAVKILQGFRKWLIDLSDFLLPNEMDLVNIRDDMLKDVDQTLYLFTFQ
jgi:hypothetical protein